MFRSSGHALANSGRAEFRGFSVSATGTGTLFLAG